jgi:Fe-coproporphyrin III synthase
MFEMFHYAGWYLSCRVFGKRKPLQSVVFIGSVCNLQCLHCAIAKGVAEGKIPKFNFPMSRVKDLMQQCYDAGSRMVTFEGGEPLMWRDGDKTVEDLVKEAKKMGFVSTSFSTNGTLPIPNSCTDRIFVSLDGTREFHDAIRGKGQFDLLVKNVAASKYPHISVNFVANRINYGCIDDLMKELKSHKNIKGISFNLHTPHGGTEDMLLPREKRIEFIDKVIKYKKEGYTIINSTEGLRRLRENSYKPQCWITDFVLPDGKRYAQCMGSLEPGVCKNCGYGMGAEMSAIWELKPSTIIEGMKLFSKV